MPGYDEDEEDEETSRKKKKKTDTNKKSGKKGSRTLLSSDDEATVEIDNEDRDNTSKEPDEPLLENEPKSQPKVNSPT